MSDRGAGGRGRWWRPAAAVAAGAGVVAVAVTAALGYGGTNRPEPDPDGGRPVATTPIVRETLTDVTAVPARLGYGEPVPLAPGASGMVTWLPPVGATVSLGEPLLRVDEQPVVLLYGSIPLYRQLARGVEGNDVAQLERNLRALGHVGFTPDRVFSAATEDALRRWQRSLGLAETGVVGLGQVAYAPGPVRVARHLVRVGASATGEVLAYTGIELAVAAAVPLDQAAWARRDARVTVVLPQGAQLAGTVVGATPAGSAPAGDAPGGSAPAGGAQGGGAQGGSAEPDSSGGPTVTVMVRVDDQRALQGLAETRVELRYVVEERRDVLTVPVAALLALAEGGYGLELSESGGGSRVVAVQVGLFAGGRVEVRGAGLAAGMAVVVPG
ncbi:MAG TPA: peptidoglycan-binding domain-containing protein [Micromonosporaceae bacterium]|nr:peptidoglycan-binding domain-containing protein [Micromonosporaceae bacterium]